ncbi:L,D-transpeptidase family protein [Eubacterium oxidoreducens]|uniref:Putative peptidoglycan binding domain-containing protein n=1 Tax=Eubacterium oxidoreducens TaxID=1732 RepID=A0A1G6BV92_EUBOX|nr:L,D-transpeptidase family protein [Eubacterium oxidoreducens]SDB24505.1 Putative peptidoglycan binding domain-containing protein [Eubacterium oxidoreducens]
MSSMTEPQQIEEKKAKKKKIIWIIVIVVIAAAIAAAVFAYNNAHIIVNGQQIRYSSDGDVETALTEQFYENGYVFSDPEMEQACVTYSIDTSGLDSGSRLFSSLFHKEYEVTIETSVDTDKLEAYIDEWNESATESENATVDSDDNITAEVYGNKIDKEALLEAVTEDATGIDVSKYYVQPTVTQEDMEAAVAEKEEYLAWSATYENGFEITIPEDSIKITKKAKVKVDTSFLEESVDDLDDTYNTIGDPVSFTTTGGENIELSGGYWGTKVDETTEIAYLEEAIANKETVSNREPQMAGQGGEIGNTYAEVSISQQHVWVYVDGKLVMQSDCVTGEAGENDTPTGAYYLLERKTDKVLVGEDYETEVNYWMRITWTGVGFHDASWRSSFGGNIYKTNGSHGCINLPASFAASLFEVAYAGMPVLIY